nr:hypothetical protein [Tanacetum cinerariifolium]
KNERTIYGVDYKPNAPLFVVVASVWLFRGEEGGGDDDVVVVRRLTRGEWRRVVASGVVGLIDRETGSVFGVRRKRSPEKFSGGDGGGGG